MSDPSSRDRLIPSNVIQNIKPAFESISRDELVVLIRKTISLRRSP
jgi:hypothetical protein